MNFEDFIPYLNKTDADPVIQQMLSSLGVKKTPKIARDDIDARVSLNDQGIDIVFNPTDEPRSSLLELTAVMVYGNTQGGEVTPYAGLLPFGLTFKDTRKLARKKLGEPAFIDDEFDKDTWDFPTHSITLNYTAGGKSIGYLDLAVPYVSDDDSADQAAPSSATESRVPLPSHVPDGDELLPLLGKQLDDPAVLACLTQVARGIHPELDPDDEDVLADWVPLNEIGLEFGFEDTAFLHALDDDLRRQNGITLSQLYFYGDTPQMRPFPSKLPFGLTFSDDRAAARGKLAAFEATRRSYIRDAWRLPDFGLTLAYDDHGLLESVRCQVPHSPWSPLTPPPALTPDALRALFGLRWSDTGLRKALAPFGYDDVRDDVKDDQLADFRRLCGLEVEFAPGARLAAADPKFPKALAVAAFVYYAEREVEARGWTGSLPFGLDFGDTQDALIAKVGRPPDEQDDDILSGSATWHFDDSSLQVIYSNLENRPLRIRFAAAGFLT